MAIYDRDYVFNKRGGGFGLGGGRGFANPANTWIIIANVAVFLFQVFLLISNRPDFLSEFGHFSTYEVTLQGGLEFWRFLTFQFLHANILHIFFNMLGLYIFGGMVEQQLGTKRYLAFYLVCGIAGGLMYLLLNAIGVQLSQGGVTSFPGLLFNDPRTPLVGASAGVFGVIMACAYIAPNMQVQLLFPPIPMKLRTLAYAYVAIAVLTLVFRGQNAGGEAAHIGGAIAGFFFIRNSHLLRDFFDVFSDSRREARRDRKAKASQGGGSGRFAKTADDVEVDRILDKVKTEGLHRLSDREKSILAKATETRRKSGS